MANEVRLIDANTMREDWLENGENEHVYDTNAVLDSIDAQPTVDAVEVVRCKDCKHYGWEQEPCHGRTQRFCRLHKGLVVVYRDTFCSYGERKDNG